MNKKERLWQTFLMEKINKKTSLRIPKDITTKKREQFVVDNILFIENGTIRISGGGRILLFLVWVEGGWKKFFPYCIKKNRKDLWLEGKYFLHRQKKLGIIVKPAFAWLNDGYHG